MHMSMYTLLNPTEFSSLQERTVSGCVTVWGTTGTAPRVPWGSPRTGHCWGWGSPPPSPCGTRTQTSSDTASWLSPTHQTSSKYPLSGKHTFSLLKVCQVKHFLIGCSIYRYLVTMLKWSYFEHYLVSLINQRHV